MGPAVNGHTLDLDVYYAEFDQKYREANAFWKFERGQHYAEPANPSWRAFHDGDWDRSLELMEADRDRLIRHHQELADLHTTTYRIRIIDANEPLTPYLQWEMHLLRLRDETGGNVRICSSNVVAPFEHAGHELPDLNICAPLATYIPNYDSNGVLASATRYPWQSTTTQFVAALYYLGWPISDYFDTHIAHLPPPALPPQLPDDYLEITGRPQPTRT